MMSGYFLRLLCLCGASFLLVHTFAAFATWLATPAILRRSAAANPRIAANWLFTLRMAPGTLALLVTSALCLPSYIWYEPTSASERIGFACAAAALAGMILVLSSVLHAGNSLRKSARFRRSLENLQTARAVSPEICSISAGAIETEQPLLALSGILRPRILISRRLLNSLSPAELRTALGHEHAHHFSSDNLKRLLLRLAPPAFPFSGRAASLERAWLKFSEWAADDVAVDGDPSRRLALASALVHVARMGAAPQLAPLHSSLVAPGEDLAARVNRLLGRAESEAPVRNGKRVFLAGISLLGCIAGAALLHPAAFQVIHSVLETLLH